MKAHPGLKALNWAGGPLNRLVVRSVQAAGRVALVDGYASNAPAPMFGSVGV